MVAWISRWIVKLSDQLGKAIRYALPDDIIVHGPQLMSDAGLDFSVEATLLSGCRIFAGLRLYILHVLIHVSPRVKSLKSLKIIFN